MKTLLQPFSTHPASCCTSTRDPMELCLLLEAALATLVLSSLHVSWWSPRSWSARQRAPQPPRLRHEDTLSPHYPPRILPRQSLPSYWLGRARHLDDHPVGACSRVPRAAVLHWPHQAISLQGTSLRPYCNDHLFSACPLLPSGRIEHLEARAITTSIWETRHTFPLDLCGTRSASGCSA
jgi:hypothetical protein